MRARHSREFSGFGVRMRHDFQTRSTRSILREKQRHTIIVGGDVQRLNLDQ